MLAFALTIFSGSFLLFQVQPLIAKYILPWFGGGPGVWTTCMLFFQVLLLCGYAYAHLLIRGLRPRAQASVHLALLAFAVALLPITPGAVWKPQGGGNPVLGILALLAACVGCQGLVLSSTGPLLQRWFHMARPDASPYPLYALSNLGSLLALVSYPFLVEPNLSRRAQAWVWSAVFRGFALLAGFCAVRAWRQRAESSEPEGNAAALDASGLAPSAGVVALWLCLPACASLLLLAVTNELCVDVAVIPFLWILPLSLYLLSFVLCFHSPRWYPRPVFAPALLAGLAGVCVILHLASSKDASIVTQIAVFSAALFACCMVCHGELVRLKPHPRHLTAFYLLIATGGAAGGGFVALLAPLLFRGYFEFHLGLLACWLLALVAWFRDRSFVLYRGRPRWAWAGLAALSLALAWSLGYEAYDFKPGAIRVSRSFYGVLAVTEYDEDNPRMHRYVLSHGSTLHGLQFEAPDKRRWATSYFGEGSGIGLTMRLFPRQSPIKIGVIGLGVGTLAAWGKKGDSVHFYEINPEVKHLAETRFTYLSDTPAQVEVVLGDARISMEREAPQGFDVLVLDAFSSDAIPVHLLTQEAFLVYLRHLKPGGVIAAHISNVYLDLQPVLYNLADHFHLERATIEDFRRKDRDKSETDLATEDWRRGLYSSTWILLTRDPSFLEKEEIQNAASEPEEAPSGVGLWTDDHTSLFPILKY